MYPPFLFLLEPVKSSAGVVVKTVSATGHPSPVVLMSSMKVPPIKPAASKTTTNAQLATPSTSAPPSSVVKSASPVTIKPISASHPVVTVPISTISAEQAPFQTVTAAPITTSKAKTTINISVSKPQANLAPPPVVPPKPHSPVLTFPSNEPISPVPTSAPTIGKPISSVPMYVPTGPGRATTPSQPASAPTTSTSISTVTPVTISPPVVVVQSLTPVLQGGDSQSTPSGRITPSGCVTPSGRRTPLGKPGEGSLRQGVPQKPYTFMDEKARYPLLMF